MSSAVERKGRSQNNEVHHQVRKKCADTDIELARANLIAGGTLSLAQSFTASGLFLLHFLGRLPEEQIRADSCPQDGNQSLPAFFAVRHGGYEGMMQRRLPV